MGIDFQTRKKKKIDAKKAKVDDEVKPKQCTEKKKGQVEG